MKKRLATIAILSALTLGCDREPTPPPVPPTNPRVDAPTPAAPDATPTAAPAAPAAPQPVEIGSIKNVHLIASCYTAGAPAEADFKLLAERGVKAVVNLRESSEASFDEAAAAEAAGLKYVHIPFAKPDTLTDAVFDKFRATMKEFGGADVLVHCGSANRVGAVWMTKRVLDDGLSPEAALAEAKTIGLRTDALIDKANDYIARHRVEGE